MKYIIESIKYLWLNKYHVLLIIPLGLTLYTFIHEASHSTAVLFQGGTVTEFVWLPTEGYLGYMRYQFDSGIQYSSVLILIFPYLIWLIIALLGISYALIHRFKSYHFASFIFIWIIALPLGDIANAVIPYLIYYKTNDLFQAFGYPTWHYYVFFGISILIAALICFFVQKKMYQEKHLSLPAYLILSGAFLFPMCI